MDTLFPPDQEARDTQSSPRAASKRQKHLDSILVYVATMLEHYFVRELSAGEQRVVNADWQVALEPFSLPAIIEARRRWIETKERRPTIPEFIRLVGEVGSNGRISDDAAAMAMGPPQVISNIRQNVPYSQLTPDERWSWHARMRVWAKRRGVRGPDPDGTWRCGHLEEQAARELPPENGRDAYVSPPLPDDPETVRPDWRSLRARDLTAAERRLHDEEAGPMIERLLGSVATMARRSDEAFGRRMAREIPAPGSVSQATADVLMAHLDKASGRQPARERSIERAKELEELPDEIDF